MKRHLTPMAFLATVLLSTAIGFCQTTWSTGDVFVAVGNGKYNVYHNNGDTYSFLEALNDGSTGSSYTTGCTFDANGNLFTTNFSNTKVYKFSPNSTTPSFTIDTGAHDNITSGDSTVYGNSESVVIDSSGNLYVGDADANHFLQKYDPSGTFITTFSPVPQDRGTDWIDLASDQKTLFYTSEGTVVKRFDVSASAQLADFASGLPVTSAAYAMRLLPPFDGSGGLLVADTDAIRRLDGSGNVLAQTYTAGVESAWFGLALDPNGTSFWAQDASSENLYRFNIASGTVEVGPIATGGVVGGGGICVKGQGSATLVTSYTTSSQTTSAGGSNTFTDPGGSGTNETYVFPTTTTFQDGNNSCSSPSMAIQFQYWDPTLFNSSRLPGVAQSPNWCGDGLNGDILCTTPVPSGSACAAVVANGKSCIVEEAKCFCGSTQLAQCNVTGGMSTGGMPNPILVSNAGFTYASPAPTNPGLVIGDDGQNDWALMPQAPDGATCTTNCSTQKLNTDITILNVNQPDFSLTATSPLTLGVGGSATSTVSLSALNGFTGSVALSVTNSPPAGISTSGLPASPVTLPSSPSLTVSAAPYVTPTSFTLDVFGTSPGLNHYAFVTVNVVANTSSITNLIGTLLSNGCIDNAGIANALTSKLSAAQAFINAGGNLDAINTLTAFKNQTSAQSGKHIHSSCTIGGVTFNAATVLISDAQGLINSLRLGTISDPITGYVLNSSGAGVQGATVSIVSDATTLTATTDVTGFYYFAMTNLLTSGSTYSIQVVSPFPTPYTTSVPAYSTFTWTTVGFNSNFTLN